MQNARGLVWLLAASLASCSLLVDEDKLTGKSGESNGTGGAGASGGAAGSGASGGSGGSFDGSVDSSGGSGGTTGGAGGSAGMAGAAGGGNGCKGVHGPSMVRIDPSYCIDSTEVTNAQYGEFLLAKAGDMSGQPPQCADNVQFAPDYWYTSLPDEHPVRVVDWCDAYAYCSWAGKRLCGAIGGGGPLAQANAFNKQSEWIKACTRNEDGLHRYPYGPDHVPGRCRDSRVTNDMLDQVVPVGTMPECEGGYAGIFDMSGNVQEWGDYCEPGATPAEDKCVLYGGSYNFQGDSVFCQLSSQLRNRAPPLNGNAPSNGIRCCSD